MTTLCLMGCSPNGTEASTEISFMIFGDPAERAAYEALINAFENEHPTIQVQLIHIPSQSDYRARIGADFAANTPSDVVLINYRRYAQFAARGVLEPLGDYLDRSTLLQSEDFYPEALEPFYWDGKLICIPQNLSSLVVYYNKNLFDAAGITYPSDNWIWDDFLQTAKTLTQDLDGDGNTDIYGLGTEVSIVRLAPFVWQNGGELTNTDFNPTVLTLDRSNEGLEALQWFMQLQTVHKVIPNAATESAEDSESRFMNGRTAMYFNSRRGVPTYREITAFDWDVAPLPQGKQRAGVLHADAYCMPRMVEDKEVIWTFIEYANSPTGQTIIAQSGRTVPSLRAVAESAAFLDPSKKPLNSQVFLDVIPDLKFLPIMPTWVEIEEILTEELQLGFYNDPAPHDIALMMSFRTLEYFDPPQR